jgi:fructokinase
VRRIFAAVLIEQIPHPATCPPQLVAGIEAGGTKFVCAVGTGPSDLLRTTFDTGADPARVLQKCVLWLRAQQEHRGPLAAIGIGSFGPVDLHPASPTYGHILSTPKPGWQRTNILGAFRAAFP